MINFLHEQIEYTMGRSFFWATDSHTATTANSCASRNVTNNQFRIDRSVIGAVNTAEVAKIEVSMNNIQNQDSADFTAAIKSLLRHLLQRRITGEQKRRTA